MTYLSDLAASLQPYVPGEQPKDKILIKLNTNENPYPPSPRLNRVLAGMNTGDFRLYPPPECEELRDAIAGAYDVKRENVYIANGSDELLAWCFPAFFTDAPLVVNDITYSFYRVYAKLFSVDLEVIPLEQDFSIPYESYLNMDRGMIIANPNAPTGQRLELGRLENIVKTNQNRVVVVDEAYVDFGCESAVGLTKAYDNVLVVQTLSKSRSLAGIRCGYAIGSESLIDGIARVKNSINSYTLDTISLKLAKAAIEDGDYFKETVNKIITTRERVSKQLRELGFIFADSFANFLFITHPLIKASALFSELRKEGILVRHFDAPRINDHLRVTVGTDEQMDTLIKVLKKIMNKN